MTRARSFQAHRLWSNFAPCCSRPSARGAIHLVCAAAVLLVFTSGCGSKDEADPVIPADGAAGNTSQGMPVAPDTVQPQSLQVPKNADPKVILDELNFQLRRWIMSNRRTPKDFEEFVTTARMQVPPAPAGKKYHLSSEMRIELVDQ